MMFGRKLNLTVRSKKERLQEQFTELELEKLTTLQKYSLQLCQQRGRTGLYFKYRDESWKLVYTRAFKCFLQYSVAVWIFLILLIKFWHYLGWPMSNEIYDFWSLSTVDDYFNGFIRSITFLNIPTDILYKVFHWEPRIVLDYLSIPVLELAGKGLLVTTAIDLAYMLFTPGPDEAVEPVITGIAAFVLIALSQDLILDGPRLIGVALMILMIPVLFYVKKIFIER
jgi:hypothetical protein